MVYLTTADIACYRHKLTVPLRPLKTPLHRLQEYLYPGHESSARLLACNACVCHWQNPRVSSCWLPLAMSGSFPSCTWRLFEIKEIKLRLVTVNGTKKRLETLKFSFNFSLSTFSEDTRTSWQAASNSSQKMLHECKKKPAFYCKK